MTWKVMTFAGSFSSAFGNRSVLGNMVYSYTVDRNIFCRRVCSHWTDDYKERGMANEGTHAGMHFGHDRVRLADSREEIGSLLP
jgi:hypothetical protein